MVAFAHRGFRTSTYYRILCSTTEKSLWMRLVLTPIFFVIRILLMPSNTCDISPGAVIGPGLFLPHPIGVVIAPQVIVGANCSIFSDVVLGINHLCSERQGPQLGNQVTIYTGAKVIGGIVIGSRVIIGANAVVVSDVPSQAIIAGIPARVIRIDETITEIPF